MPDLKKRVEEAAKRNGRSLNLEITARLEWSLQQEASQPLSADVGVSEELDRRLRVERWELQEAIRKLQGQVEQLRSHLGIVGGDE